MVCTAILPGHKLVFRGHNEYAYATVEKATNSRVPVVVWELDAIAEKRLDHYEGFPRFYRKELLKIKLPTGNQQAMIYIMTDGYPIGVPDRHYYEGIFEAYQEFNLATDSLEKALEEAAAQNFLNLEKCARCGGPLEIRTMSRMNTDILCPDCAEAEKAHPQYQEAKEAEIEQVRRGNYNYQGLFAGRVYPFPQK
jgi:gamma-glutamylcyclotransferase (GGCT)/AIG2-like uncharacterized protein YtfP